MKEKKETKIISNINDIYLKIIIALSFESHDLFWQKMISFSCENSETLRFNVLLETLELKFKILMF